MFHLDQLAAFDRVAREGSFSRAAMSMGLGQPAVSARILALEDALGGTVFVRARRIRLTALGETFLPFARRALDLVREGTEVARLAQVGERGSVRIGALGSLAGELVGPALAEFLRGHPKVECTVRSGHHEFLLELLADGFVDAALTVWPPGGALELHAIFKLRERVLLVAAPAHPLARRKEVRYDEVARLGQPLLRLRWWRAHHPRLSALADESQTSVEVAMETARRLVLAGTGAGFFPEKLIAEDLKRGTLREVRVRGLDAIYRDTALVRRPNSPMSPSLASFIRVLRKVAKG